MYILVNLNNILLLIMPLYAVFLYFISLNINIFSLAAKDTRDLNFYDSSTAVKVNLIQTNFCSGNSNNLFFCNSISFLRYIEIFHVKQLAFS